MEIFKAYDLKAGVVSLGGNVQCCGTKPDGSLWRCGIRDPNAPDDPNALLGVMSVADRAVITSGAYERNLPDRRAGLPPYHRSVHRNTGGQRPLFITVISADGTLADGLSTACYVMGLDKSLESGSAMKNFDLILMTNRMRSMSPHPLPPALHLTTRCTLCNQKGEGIFPLAFSL